MRRNVSRVVLVAALALSLPVPAAADANWWNASWTARRKPTFNNAAQATNLVGFPVTGRLDSGRIDYAKVQDSGQDLASNAHTGLMPELLAIYHLLGDSATKIR